MAQVHIDCVGHPRAFAADRRPSQIRRIFRRRAEFHHVATVIACITPLKKSLFEARIADREPQTSFADGRVVYDNIGRQALLDRTGQFLIVGGQRTREGHQRDLVPAHSSLSVDTAYRLPPASGIKFVSWNLYTSTYSEMVLGKTTSL